MCILKLIMLLVILLIQNYKILLREERKKSSHTGVNYILDNLNVCQNQLVLIFLEAGHGHIEESLFKFHLY